MTSDLGIVPWTRREFQHEIRRALMEQGADVAPF